MYLIINWHALAAEGIRYTPWGSLFMSEVGQDLFLLSENECSKQKSRHNSFNQCLVVFLYSNSYSCWWPGLAEWKTDLLSSFLNKVLD